MSNIWWGFREPGDAAAIGRDSPNELLFGAEIPDWTTLPPEMGGHQVRIIGHHIGKCPHDPTHLARHLHLEGNNFVAECVVEKQFFWYTKKKNE